MPRVTKSYLVFLAIIGAMGVRVHASAGDKPKHVIHIMADDLGYGDVGWRTKRTERVETPTLDALVSAGVEIPEHYSYKMCSPSRVSTLTGRYPYHAGYYNNNGGDDEGAPIDYTLLPGHLKKAGWKTHALGKWHAGWIYKRYTPTYRGFDTCLVSSGNLDGYWGSQSGGHCTKDAAGDIVRFDGFDEERAKKQRQLADGSDDDSAPVAGMATDLLRGVGEMLTPARGGSFGNGTVYDARMYTAEAKELIAAHDTSQSFYLYMAFHNVHVPIEFPRATAERYPFVASDARKGTDAQLTELDWTVGNISQALEAKNMLDDTLFIFHSDNGGPGSHAVNYPHRGGKFSFWEGGVRTVAFVSWRGLPAAVRGTQMKGLAHLTDWYVTIAEGIAGVNASEGGGWVPPDGHNLWPTLTGAAAVSPRTEVVHMPSSNKYNNASDCRKGPGHGCSPAIRVGDLKLIVGWPGSDNLWSYDDMQKSPTPFGQKGGTCVSGTDRCTAPHWKQQNPGSGQKSKCVPYCLFNVSLGADLHERNDLAGEDNPQLKAAAKAMLARLDAEAKTGAPLAYIPGADKKVAAAQCNVYAQTGYWLPSDMPGFTPGPTPAPTPAPPTPAPAACTAAMQKTCPRTKFSDYTACRNCCHDHADALHQAGDCKPKDYSAYCGKAEVDLNPNAKLEIDVAEYN